MASKIVYPEGYEAQQAKKLAEYKASLSPQSQPIQVQEALKDLSKFVKEISNLDKEGVK